MTKPSFTSKPRLTSHARLVLERRYLRRDEENHIVETPAQMLARVDRVVAQAEAIYGSPKAAARTAAQFYDLMAALEFLPNSPTLMNAGRELGQLSACFVLPVEDSIESIFNAVRDTAIIHKSGGGTGFSFSSIRPAHDRVKSTYGISSGPLSFMNVFDVATETIKQGGTRRGANMGLLSVHHPDIMDFIKIKAENPGRFLNFNLSVSVTDRFMEAVQADRSFDLIIPHTGRRQGVLSAGAVFEEIARAAWLCGDPGLVFIDRVNEANPLPHLGRLEATNPCGEQPLLPYESCNLGSINLARFVKRGRIDWTRLGSVVHQAVHFLDNVIDMNRFPLPQIREMTLKNRKIGLGVMGLADMLIRLGLPYNSQEALDLCGKLMAFIQAEAKQASVELAEKRGNFPSFEGSVYQKQGRRFMRNATVTTIAPTGTISIIANCSSGIEPVFAVAYRRRVLEDREFVEVNPLFKRLAKNRGFWSEELGRKAAQAGTVQGLKEAPEDIRKLFATAHEIPPRQHLRVQAAFQAHTDNAVSKTINLPHETETEVVREIFLDAYREGLKGVTVYRDRCREDQVLRMGHEQKSKAVGPAAKAEFNPDDQHFLEPDASKYICRRCG